MAVMQNSIIFGGVDSADFGIYIGGEGTFNAPKRDVEMISIPGRNGAFALDKGRFQNIEVTYSAFNREPDLATFSAQLEGFRNAICSQKGYQRLTDTFHPDEYRMAAYIDGLEIKPIEYNTAATFDIKFDCKPQRYLTSGEEPITIGEWHETETASGSIASFEAKEGDAVKSLVVDIEPMQSGSGTPSPTNIRPISGYDSVVVSRCGKNLLSIPSVSLVKPATRTASINIDEIPAGTYKFTCNYSGTANNVSLVFRKQASVTADQVQINPNGVERSVTFTVPMKNIYVFIASSETDGVTADITNMTVRLASETDATYEPYQGNTYTINLNGTRYGGTLDVVSGELTVTHVAVDLGSLTWEVWPGYTSIFRCGLPSGCKTVGNQGVPNWLCSAYAVTSGVSVSSTIGSIGQLHASYVLANNPSYTDASAFKTAMTGQTLVYELATPTTVQLTAEEVELLVGLNQVWANSGDVSVEYGTAPNVVYNPTLFESSPMLEVEGYGNININDDAVLVENKELGRIKISDSSTSQTVDLDVSNLETGDEITSSQNSYYVLDMKAIQDTKLSVRILSGPAEVTTISTRQKKIRVTSNLNSAPPKNGTAETKTVTVQLHITVSGVGEYDATLQLNTIYSATNNDIMLSPTRADFPSTSVVKYTSSYKHYPYYGDSTKSVLPSPMYIDLDIGEAYGVIGGEPLSFDNLVTLPAELPKLKSGANTITADNTVTDLKVVPRYWKV